MVEVVNMRTCRPEWGQPGDVRVDRATKWGNPYPITDTETRDDVIAKYTLYLLRCLGDGTLNVSDLKEAKRLGCWCKPAACHGDVLRKAVEDVLQQEQSSLASYGGK